MPHHPYFRFLLYLGFVLVVASVISGDSLNKREGCGKRIYFQGIDCLGHDIKAFLGDMEVSARIQTCSSCHGADGKGRPESGLDPGDITWEHLSVSYGHAHETGRKHPAFTEQSFYLTVTQGIDPASHKLSPVMPRFQMSHQEAANLLAYLKRLSSDFDPGLDPTSIKIGNLVPAKGSDAEAGNAVRGVLAAYFDEINQRGGIYGRRILLQSGEAGATDLETIDNAHHLIQMPIFAMVAPFVPGAEKELARLADEDKLPVVGPLTLSVPDNAENSKTFYLSPGLKQLAEELVRWGVAQRHFTPSASAIIFAGARPQEEVSPAVASVWHTLDSGVPREFNYSPANTERLVQDLQTQGVTAVIFAGPGGDALKFIQASVRVGWIPQVFLLGPLAGSEVLEAPAQFQDKIYAAYPALASAAQAREEFDAFSQRHHLPKAHRLLQVSAYCAAKILEDALARAGSELSREKLIRSLEQTRNFQTGLLPEITFGPNRHVGSAEVNILCADLRIKQFRQCDEH
jgi:ABC-type branched-subunit amino acid transport system substrate-binding protein